MLHTSLYDGGGGGRAPRDREECMLVEGRIVGEDLAVVIGSRFSWRWSSVLIVKGKERVGESGFCKSERQA